MKVASKGILRPRDRKEFTREHFDRVSLGQERERKMAEKRVLNELGKNVSFPRRHRRSVEG